ncbi:protein of unknown function [Methylorubrum extorquens]|uniref:Uncharacterized protein n=1 Tax=Methylorubrum extorquens TaxID=408 RepID=A0A2N9AM58_METEX|nr:protein of unknown function [Methylorubrum extorquens]
MICKALNLRTCCEKDAGWEPLCGSPGPLTIGGANEPDGNYDCIQPCKRSVYCIYRSRNLELRALTQN